MDLKPGDYILNTQDTATNNYGTAGGVVKDANGKLVMLTCFHCIFTRGMSWLDSSPSTPFANASFSEGNGFDSAGIIQQTKRDDRVDIALISAKPGRLLETSIPLMGKTNGPRFLTEEDKGALWLRKYGAVTHDTYGQFDGFSPTTGTIYPGETTMHYLNSLIKIITPDGTKFSEEGDSGAFVLDDKNRVAGVIVMGTDNVTYAIQAGIIQTRLNITFI